MSAGPVRTYRNMLRGGHLRDDPAQRHAVEKLQLLHNRLADYVPARPKRVGIGIFGWGREKLELKPVPGLYMYGSVGRGKSMLMDLFYNDASIEPRRRVHFHAFMQEVHAGINAARARGVEDPIVDVANTIADEASLLCFDELQITDITDAMIVGRLFERLFERGVVVVTTSNRPPDDLYKDGLNRQLFLPFIELIKQRLEVHHLAGGEDFRQNQAFDERTYFSPLGQESTDAMDRAWHSRTDGAKSSEITLTVSGRKITLPQFAKGCARSTFAELCAVALGPADYLSVAASVEILFIDDIPKLGIANNNEAKRFVTLIDALYEARRVLFCSAAAEPEVLYEKGAGAFEFARTASRLREMQGSDWIANAARDIS